MKNVTIMSTLVLTSLCAPLSTSAQDNAMIANEQATTDDRYTRGLRRLDEVTQNEGQAVVDRLARTSPDLARYTIEYPYGDVFSRPGLNDRDRELATVSALISMGFAKPELKVHMHGALNVGVMESELEEIVILMSVYAGFPASLHGLRALEEVLEERAERGSKAKIIREDARP